MSFGYVIVLFIIIRLVDVVGEKLLVLFDELEVYLYLFLFFVFLRILSDLFDVRNGVVIIVIYFLVVL